VAKACKKHGGFYLGSIGGPAAILAQDNITKVNITTSSSSRNNNNNNNNNNNGI
jgi:hypothetical protein